MAIQFTAFDGQLSKDQLKAAMGDGRQARLAARAEFLKAHPDYLPCAVAGCEGLVNPMYIRGYLEDGTPWGLCPRTAIHARLAPELFAQPSNRRSIRSTPSDWAKKPDAKDTKAK